MIVDIHGHITSPELRKRYPIPPSLVDVDGMIEKKAAAGIDLTIVGTPVGAGTMIRLDGHDNYAQTSDQLKAYNEWIAETVAAHREHLRAYAYTNPFGGERMLADAATTVRDGGFVGIIANTSVRGAYLDDERADDFFAMVDDLDVPVFLHPPAEPVGSASLRDFRLVEQIGRYCDATLGLAALIFGGCSSTTRTSRSSRRRPAAPWRSSWTDSTWRSPRRTGAGPGRRPGRRTGGRRPCGTRTASAGRPRRSPRRSTWTRRAPAAEPARQPGDVRRRPHDVRDGLAAAPHAARRRRSTWCGDLPVTDDDKAAILGGNAAGCST